MTLLLIILRKSLEVKTRALTGKAVKIKQLSQLLLNNMEDLSYGLKQETQMLINLLISEMLILKEAHCFQFTVIV